MTKQELEAKLKQLEAENARLKSAASRTRVIAPVPGEYKGYGFVDGHYNVRLPAGVPVPLDEVGVPYPTELLIKLANGEEVDAAKYGVARVLSQDEARAVLDFLIEKKYGYLVKKKSKK